MPLFIGVFLCFPSRAGVGACERARERPCSRARSARLLAPARCSPLSRLFPYQTRSRWSRACYGNRLLRGRALPPLVIGSRPPFGRLPLLSAARSLRSLACSANVRSSSSGVQVSDALPMVARLIPARPSFLPRDRSAFLRARSARLLAPARCSPLSRLFPYQTRSRWSRACYGNRLLRGRALPPLVIGSRPPFGRLPLLSAARSLRSLACSANVRSSSSGVQVSDALPMVARLIPARPSFLPRDRSAFLRARSARLLAPARGSRSLRGVWR